MSTAAVLERPVVVEFETAAKDGIIEAPDEMEMAREQLMRAFAYGNEHGRKHGITEEMINEEIEAYRKEKAGNENSYRR